MGKLKIQAELKGMSLEKYLSHFNARLFEFIRNNKITSVQSNLTKDRINAADGQSSRICQVAPVCPAMWVHLRHLANTIKLCFLRHKEVHNPKSNSTGSAVSAQRTAESPYT